MFSDGEINMPIREGVGTYEVLDGILDRRLHANNNQEGMRNECGWTTATAACVYASRIMQRNCEH